MKFMFLLHGDEARMLSAGPEAVAEMMAAYAAYGETLVKAGAALGGERLRPSAEAGRVEVRDGDVQVLDGPYSATKEQMGGYMLIDAPDRATAFEWAARCPAARVGTVEVRQIWEN